LVTGNVALVAPFPIPVLELLEHHYTGKYGIDRLGLIARQREKVAKSEARRRSSELRSATLRAIRLDWWAASDWNGARNTFGIPGRLRRNPHRVHLTAQSLFLPQVTCHMRAATGFEALMVWLAACRTRGFQLTGGTAHGVASR
jgi:hypothetical protein